MANWCYGNMEISGKKESVLNFLKNELIPVAYDGNHLHLNPIVTVTDDHIQLIRRTDNEMYHSMWLKGSYKGFLTESYIKVLNNDTNKYTVNLQVEFCYFAYGEFAIKPAGEHNVAIDINVIEENNEFRQIIKVDNTGKILKDIQIGIHDDPNSDKSTLDHCDILKSCMDFVERQYNCQCDQS